MEFRRVLFRSLCKPEESLSRTVTKHVEDDVYARTARVLDLLPRLLHLLDADAVVENLPLGHEVVERSEHLRHVIHVSRRAVKLQQVDGLTVEIPEASLDEWLQVRFRIGLGHVRVEPPTRLGGDADIRKIAAQLSDKTFATAIAIDIGRVEEVDAQLRRALHRAKIGRAHV